MAFYYVETINRLGDLKLQFLVHEKREELFIATQCKRLVGFLYNGQNRLEIGIRFFYFVVNFKFVFCKLV